MRIRQRDEIYIRKGINMIRLFLDDRTEDGYIDINYDMANMSSENMIDFLINVGVEIHAAILLILSESLNDIEQCVINELTDEDKKLICDELINIACRSVDTKTVEDFNKMRNEQKVIFTTGSCNGLLS